MQLRVNLATAMHYRLDFIIQGVLSLWWMAWTLAPILIVFQARAQVAGWTFAESLVVIAWFTLLRALLEGIVNPSLLQIVDHIRMGTLDFVLIKPVDAQFLVSTAKFQPWKIVDLIASGVILGVAFHKLGRLPAVGDALVAVILLVTAALVLYSIWLLVVCAAFWVVRLDNLTYLFTSIFDAARWPLSIFRGVWRILFTFVIPLGLMTTYPAMAILGRLEARTAGVAIAGALTFAVAARLIWTRALGHYTSASS